MNKPKPKPTRTVSLNPIAFERLFAEIDCGEAEAIASVFMGTGPSG